MSTRDEKRAELRKRLIDAAERQLGEKGLGGLKAREVTTEAGCALGALYNAFEDLDMLILHVNSRTLSRLGEALREAAPAEAAPGEVLQALARCYVGFACDNLRLWSALFEHRMPEGVETPDWHRHEHLVLIAEILGPLRQLRPDLDDEALQRRAMTTFAAVHGVVQLSLQGRFVGVPGAVLREEVSALVDTMIRGSHPA